MGGVKAVLQKVRVKHRFDGRLLKRRRRIRRALVMGAVLGSECRKTQLSSLRPPQDQG